ncbi:MAG TPA: arylsulfatase [Verrucomicrobiae bacterium]
MLLFPQTVRLLLLALMLGSAGISIAQPLAPAPAQPDRPNVLLIVADDLGYGDLGCYGQTKVKTPNLDRLAKEGTRFTQFYAGSPLGSSSRAALMTGRHTGHTSIRGISPIANSLLNSDVTIAEVLQKNGYNTAAAGKWDMGDLGTSGTPNNQGFQNWVGFLTGSLAQMYYPPVVFKNGSVVVIDENKNGAKGLYAPDMLTTNANRLIHLNSRTPQLPDRRFFLYFASQLPRANADLGRATGNGMEIPSDEPYTDERWPQTEKNRAAMITRLDTHVGRLMDQLVKSKVDTNTVLIFTSDNGPWRAGGSDPAFFNATGGLRGQRGDLYEGGLRVPLIVWAPGKIAASNVVDTPCAMWDILPTVADLTGATSGSVDGRSLVPALKGKAMEPAEYLYWELHNNGFAQALRTGDWKAIRPHGKPMELYNLKQDPQEKKDIAAQHPEEVKKISELMAQAHTDSDLWPVPVAANKP